MSTGGVALMVANYAPGAGYAWWLMEHFWQRLAGLAFASGMDSVLAYPTADSEGRVSAIGDVHAVVEPVPDRIGAGLWHAVRFLRTRRVRLLYFTDREYGSLAYLIFRLAGVRWIVVHDHAPGDRPPSRGAKGLLKALWRRVPLVNADAIFAVSPLIGERAVANARVPRSRVHIVQNGIKPDAGPPPATSNLRSSLGLEPHAIICVTTCRAHPYKRVDLLLDLAERCAASKPECPLVFVHCGDGPELGALQDDARRRALDSTVFFLGRRSDVPSLLRDADIAFHPSRGEAFSLAILEYMQAGLPVVVPDIPSVCQAVDDRVTGIVYPEGRTEEAARAVLELAEDISLRKAFGSAARQRVQAHYSWDAMNASFDRAVGAVLTPPNRSSRVQPRKV